MNRIRKGDTVLVIAGRNKGQHGEVTRIAGDRVFVQNVNMVKRHTKPNPQAQQPGGIVEREAPIHISNDGRKVRVYRSTGEVLDA
jgi:large subunit ribosomal protein L24